MKRWQRTTTVLRYHHSVLTFHAHRIMRMISKLYFILLSFLFFISLKIFSLVIILNSMALTECNVHLLTIHKEKWNKINSKWEMYYLALLLLRNVHVHVEELPSLSLSALISRYRVFDGLVHKDQVTTNLQKE